MTVRSDSRPTSGKNRTPMLCVKSSSSRYALISAACTSSSRAVCSARLRISSSYRRLSVTAGRSIRSRISVGFSRSRLRFWAEMPRSWDLKSRVRTSSVKRWFISSTTRLIALVSSSRSYRSRRFRKWPSYW